MDISTPKKQGKNERETEKAYWLKIYRRVMWIGLLFILLLGLFTWLFNKPV